MMKKTQGLKPDTVLKNYWRNNEQFADLFNAVLFEGKQVIRPEELQDLDTEESSVLEHKEYTESIQASRDNIKISKKSTEHGVDLQGMLNVSQEMKNYVNDYKMLLVEARKNNLILRNGNNVDLFNLLEIILDRSIPRNEAKEKAIQYSEEHKTDRSVIMTVAGATNSTINYDAYAKGDGKMCTLFEEIARENEIKGIEKGKAEGIIEIGLEMGLSEKDILERLQNKLNISLQAAQDYMERFGKQTI